MKGFSHSSVGKQSACNPGDPGSIPGSRRSPGRGNGNPPQYSCLENPMEREAWRLQSIGLQKCRHGLVTKTPPPPYIKWVSKKGLLCSTINCMYSVSCNNLQWKKVLKRICLHIYTHTFNFADLRLAQHCGLTILQF